MLVSCQLLSPSRWHSMRQLERYHPVIEAGMSAAGLRMICCRLSLPFLSVAGHAVSRSVRLMYVPVQDSIILSCRQRQRSAYCWRPGTSPGPA